MVKIQKQQEKHLKKKKKLKWALTVFFLVLGFASLAAYMKIGYENSKIIFLEIHLNHLHI